MAWSEWKKFGGGLDNPTLLWTNQTPNVAFNAQTLNISNLSDYEYIMVESYGGAGQHDIGVTPSVQIYKNNTSNALSSYYTDNYITMRLMKCSGNSITFDNGYIKANASTSGSYCIPYKIYGI